MRQIIQNVDLAKVWTAKGKEGETREIPAVVDVWEGQLFNVLLDKGEYLPQKYSCNLEILAKLEAFHGQSNIVIISKSVKGKENDNGGHYYNDTIVDVMTLAKYAKLNVEKGEYTSKFAKPAPSKRDSNVIPIHQAAVNDDSYSDRG